MSSKRGVRLECLPDSRYALNSFTTPNFSTRLRIPAAAEYPSDDDGISQFSIKSNSQSLADLALTAKTKRG